MKNKKSKVGKKLPVMIIGNTNRKTAPLSVILVIKLLLTYFMALGSLLFFTYAYDIPYPATTAVYQVLLFVIAFFALFTIFKKRILLPIMGGISLIACFLLNERIFEPLSILKDYYLLSLDSRLMHTTGLVEPDSIAYLTHTQDFNAGISLSMMIVAGLISLGCVLCCYRKFYSIVTVAMWALLFVPGFVAERIDYHYSWIMLALAFLGLRTMSLSSEYYYNVSSTGKPAKRKRTSAVAVASDNLLSFGKNCFGSIMAVALALVIAITSTIPFPTDRSYFDTNSLIIKSGNFFMSIGEAVGKLFTGESMGNLNGYLSSDNFFYNNRIELKAPPIDSERALLQISSDDKYGFYLVGDIGVQFTGIDWVSIGSGKEKNQLVPKGYNITENFNPDIMLDFFRNCLFLNTLKYDNSEGISSEEYIKTKYETYFELYEDDLTDNITGMLNLEPNPVYKEQMEYYNRINNKIMNLQYSYKPYLANSLTEYKNVDIHYLLNSKVVFKPNLSCSTLYKENPDLATFGDTVIRVNSFNGKMNSYQGDIYVPKDFLLLTLADSYNIDLQDIENFFEDTSMTLTENPYGKSAAEWYNNVQEYTRYVYDTYLDVPNGEKENIDKFLQEFYSEKSGIEECTGEFMVAFEMADFLRENYSYSLTADNSSGNNTLLGNFLFDTKSGHCAMYASVMTLALREMGIPARYVTGFSTGELTLDETDGRYKKTVRDNDLHAWVELYVEDIGWVDIDPTGTVDNGNMPQYNEIVETTDTTETTPPAETTTETTTETTETTESETEISATTPAVTDKTSVTTPAVTEKPIAEENKPDLTFVLIIAVGVIILLILILTPVIIIKTADRRYKNRFNSYTKNAPDKSVGDLYELIMKMFSYTDCAPEKGELPLDFAKRVDKKLNTEKDEINLYRVMAILEKREFSNEEISSDELHEVIAYSQRLYETILKSCSPLKQIYLKIVL